LRLHLKLNLPNEVDNQPDNTNKPNNTYNNPNKPNILTTLTAIKLLIILITIITLMNTNNTNNPSNLNNPNNASNPENTIYILSFLGDCNHLRLDLSIIVVAYSLDTLYALHILSYPHSVSVA
jgi:amino acid transporter